MVETAGGVVRVQEVQGGGTGRWGQSSLRLTFGLGAATAAERVIVRWPSGVQQVVFGLDGHGRQLLR